MLRAACVRVCSTVETFFVRESQRPLPDLSRKEPTHTHTLSPQGLVSTACDSSKGAPPL